MKYIDLHDFGAASNLYVREGARPEPKSGEVLIRVVAAGVNRPDIIQRQGHYPAPEGASNVLGLEVSGTIEAMGSDCSGLGVLPWAVGDRVCALTNGGGYAEYVCVPVGQCLPIPESLTFIQAAAIPETFFTVWSNLFMRAGLTATETLLVHGGSSGIGTAAIILAKTFGVQVLATVGSQEKVDLCLHLGADAAINYRAQDFVTEVKSFTHNRGADVILDMVGGDYLQRNMKAAAVEGRIVNIAFMRGSKTDINMMPMMMKRLTLTGSTLRAQSSQNKAAIAQQLHQNVWPKLISGELSPLIHSVFEWQYVADAHQLMESGAHSGKIVLSINTARETR